VKPPLVVAAPAEHLRATNIPGEPNDGVKIRVSQLLILDFRLPIKTVREFMFRSSETLHLDPELKRGPWTLDLELPTTNHCPTC